MPRSTLTLDLKAHTSSALNEFKAFSDNLGNKFFVSGLKLDLLRNTLNDINREFDRSMGSQGMKSAMELKQLETSSGAVFAALKGGSLDAGREMAKNIRVALGDVSKSIGSTTEDINSVMKMIPFTSKALLDKAGVGMEEFHKMNLTMVTNARDAMGEDASKIIEKLLSGDLSNTDLLNDRTGIGQMMRQKLGPFDPSAMSAEARTEAVLKLLQDDEFQSTLSGLAEDNAGFMRVVRQFKNTLFDQRTGVFGVLKESTLSLREFSGERVSQVTSIFKETTRLFKVLFDVNTGLFATIFKTIGEAFGFNSDNVTEVIIRMIRWVTNVLKTFTDFFAGPIFRGFLDGIKGIVNFFAEGFKAMTGALGSTPGGVVSAVVTFFEGLGSFIGSLATGDFQAAAEKAIAGIQIGTKGIVAGLESLSETISQSKIGEDGFGLGGLTFGATIGTMIAPGLGTVIGGVLGGLLGNELVVEIVRGTKEIVLAAVDTGLTAVTTLVTNAGGWEVIGNQTVEFIENIGVIVREFISGLTEQLTDPKIDLKGMVGAMSDIAMALIKEIALTINSVIDAGIDFRNSFGDDGFRELGRVLARLFVAAIPVIIKGFGFVLNVIEDVIAGFFQELMEMINIPEPIARFISELIAKAILIFNPGGIIGKVLGKLPLIGKAFSQLYTFITGLSLSNIPLAVRNGIRTLYNTVAKVASWVAKVPGLKGLISSLGGRFTKFLTSGIGKLFTTLTSVFGRFLSGLLSRIPIIGGILDFAMNMGEGDGAGRAGVRSATGMGMAGAGVALGGLVGGPPGALLGGLLGLVGSLVGNNTVGPAVADAMGLKHSGNIPDYTKVSNANSGLNVLAKKISEEQENTRPGASPVIANSDEIIIPPNRLREVNLVVADQLRRAFDTENPIKINPDTPKIPDVNLVIPDQLRSAFKPTETKLIPSVNIQSTKELSPANAKLLGEQFAKSVEIQNVSRNMVGNILNAPATGTAPPLLDKNTDAITKSFELIGEESEGTWQKSTDTATEFFKDFAYKAGTEWKSAISQKVTVSAPSVEIDTSGVKTSIEEGFKGLNFGEIMSSIPKGMSDGWDNVVKFFQKAGDQVKELTQRGFLDSLVDAAKKYNPLNLFNGGKSPDKSAMGLNLNNFVSSAQDELLNSGYNNSIVVANSSEIVAPKSSLTQLADLLLRDRPKDSVGINTYQNTFNIAVNGSGAEPERVAEIVLEKIDTIFTQQMLNNRVPYA